MYALNINSNSAITEITAAINVFRPLLFSRIMKTIMTPSIGFACNRKGANWELSISKNIRIAPVYATTQKGHFGSSINNKVDRKEIYPFEPLPVLPGLWIFLQQDDFAVSIFFKDYVYKVQKDILPLS